MTFDIRPRKAHQQRADRLEARFSPIWTGQPQSTTVAVLPNDPNPPNPPPAPNQPNPILPPNSPNQPVPPPQPPSPTPPSAPVQTTPAPAAVIPVASTQTPVSVATILTTPSSSPSVVDTPTAVIAPTLQPTTSLPTPTTFRSLPSDSFGPPTTSTTSPSPTSTSSSGMSTGSIVGLAAGGIAGAALVGAFGVWLLKRYFSSRDHDENGDASAFTRHSWMRNSVALPDDVPSPFVRGGPSETPRPPTMIERKQMQNYSNVAASQMPYGHGSNVGGMGYLDYQDSPYGVPSMPGTPGQHFGQPYFSPIASPPLPSPGIASFDETMPPMQHATNTPVYFSRHDSQMSGSQPETSGMPNPHANLDGYARLDRSSVTPYQAQQYAEISRKLQDAQPLPPVPGPDLVQSAQQAHAVIEPVPESAPGPALAPAQGPPIVQPETVSPFADSVATAVPYQEPAPPPPAHTRADAPQPKRNGPGPGRTTSISQIASAFPATPLSPGFPSSPGGSPRMAGFPQSPKGPQSPPLSPGVGPQKGQVVTVPEVHVVQETPVQFGFNSTAHGQNASANGQNAPASSQNASAGASDRPNTLYDEEDAYGGI